MQTCAVDSPLSVLIGAGLVFELLAGLSSCPTVPALRFLVFWKGGLSSGVNGVFDPRDGPGEQLRDRNEIDEDVRLLEAVLWFLLCEIIV